MIYIPQLKKINHGRELNIITKEQGFIDIASNLVKYENTYENIIKNQSKTS